MTFTSPEPPGGLQDLTASSPLESESNTSPEPATAPPSGWMSPMAITKPLSEGSTSAALLADTYEILSGQLHFLSPGSSFPSEGSSSQETSFFQITPASQSRSTDSLSFAEASSVHPVTASVGPSPPPIQAYTHSIHRHSSPTRKSSAGFRPSGPSMVKGGSTSAYLLGPQDTTGQMSHPAITDMVSEVSTSAALLDDTYEMLSGHLPSLPLESSIPNAESPGQETIFFQATSE